MAQYQLKVMINTSIPNSQGYTELTSDILNYEVPEGGDATSLSKYPFFDPTADYPRKEIQDMEYHKRLEVFFNEETFKSVILQQSSEKQDYSHADELDADDIDLNLDEKEDVERNTAIQEKRNKNFEFTIQTILCTGFPVNNYFQSMEFYDSKIRTKKFTLKGSSWFPFMSKRFDRVFSHLKMSGGVYTVTGVVWVNDALNHPQYMAALESFDEYNVEKKPEGIDKMKNEVEMKRNLDVNLFLLNIYRDNLNNAISIWKLKDDETIEKQNERLKASNVKSDEQNSLNIQIDFQKDILSNLEYAPEYEDKFSDLSMNLNNQTVFYSQLSVDPSPPNVSGGTYMNVFLNRGKGTSSNGSKSEEKEAFKLVDENNKVYQYVKLINNSAMNDSTKSNTHENITELMKLPPTNNTKHGIFNDGNMKDFKTKAGEMYTKIYETYNQKQEFKLDDTMKTEIINFLNNFEGLTKQFENELKSGNTKAIYWLYTKLIENQNIIEKTVRNLSEYPTIQKMMNVFLDVGNSKSKNANVKQKLETFIQKYTDDQFKDLRDTTYASELRKFIKKIRKHDVTLRAYDYVSTNADYSDDTDKDQIDQIIRDKFKNFQTYSGALSSLAKTRNISNPYWKMEANKFVGTEKGKIRAKQDTNEEQGDDMFELLSQCRDINARCKRRKKPMAVKYLNIGLDELKFGSGDKDKGSAKNSGFSTDNVFEAYIQANVIKGKITKENYAKLKCSYLNYSLGSMYKKMMKKTKENFIIGNKVYFDLEKDIAKANENLEKEKKITEAAANAKNTRKSKEDNKKDNKGGRRTRKHRRKQKRKSVHRSRKKRLLKVNKTRKIHYSS